MAAMLALEKRLVLARQQLEVSPLFLRELEEDLLAVRVLEPLAVLLEELVRTALALDANQQRLFVVDALTQLLGGRGEQSARRALEDQEHRARFELGILDLEFPVSLLELGQVPSLFKRQPPKDTAAPRVF